MSTSAGSSSLRKLAQSNHSNSTLSSSNTEVESIGYASSSARTMSEDGTRSFHLCPSLRKGSTSKSKGAVGEKSTVATKHYSFFSVIKKVRKVARVFKKKKKPDDTSPILISSPLRERLGKRMAVKFQPDEKFYNMPNRRFSFSDARTLRRRHSEALPRKSAAISSSPSGFAKDPLRKQRSEPQMSRPSYARCCAFVTSAPDTASPRNQRCTMAFKTIFCHIFRILLYVPWCATVGGALLLFPSHVELVAFQTGYVESPKGIPRFIHWAECGQRYVMIFLACLAILLWWNLALGLSLATMVVSRFIYVWHAFKVDESIPLGEDDQQSLYFVITGMRGNSRSGKAVATGKGR